MIKKIGNVTEGVTPLKGKKRTVAPGESYKKLIKNASQSQTQKQRIEVNKLPTGQKLNIQSAQMFSQIEKLKKLVSSIELPDRAEKINAIKQAIQNGTYKIDPEAVAEKILKTGFFS